MVQQTDKRSDVLIVKPCSLPINAMLIEALLQRLALGHPKRSALELELGRKMAGYWGEQSVCSILEVLPKNEYFIFHDLRLQGKPHPFQIDFLVLSPYFFLILEVKNIAGELYFDDSFKQIIRTINNQNEAFDDPVMQVNLQRKQLQAWLTAKKLPPIPIETLVVSANPKAVLRAENKRLSDMVVRKKSLSFKIEELANKHQREIISKKELKKLTNTLLKAHTPHISELLKNYKILTDELMTGVHCPNCGKLPMTRKWGMWVCSSCSFTSRDAHLRALRDYALLIKPIITNREMRKFLQLESASAAARILSCLNLPYTGSTKDRVYHLNLHDYVTNWHE